MGKIDSLDPGFPGLVDAVGGEASRFERLGNGSTVHVLARDETDEEFLKAGGACAVGEDVGNAGLQGFEFSAFDLALPDIGGGVLADEEAGEFAFLTDPFYRVAENAIARCAAESVGEPLGQGGAGFGLALEEESGDHFTGASLDGGSKLAGARSGGGVELIVEGEEAGRFTAGGATFLDAASEGGHLVAGIEEIDGDLAGVGLLGFDGENASSLIVIAFEQGGDGFEAGFEGRCGEDEKMGSFGAGDLTDIHRLPGLLGGLFLLGEHFGAVVVGPDEGRGGQEEGQAEARGSSHGDVSRAKVECSLDHGNRAARGLQQDSFHEETRTMNTRSILGLTAALATLLLVTPAAPAQKSSGDVVKASVAVEKPDASGKQVVTITLDVDSRYHIYANPVGLEDLASNQTVVTGGKGAAGGVKVEYPAGELKKDKIVGDYRIYKGKVTIKAAVQRAGADPVELTVKVQACSDKACLAPATIKLAVP